MQRFVVSAAALLFLALMVTTASAQSQGFTTTSVHMRAGPGTNYPVVATLPQDATIEISGCQVGYSWCDVSWNTARGWISNNYILVEEDGQKTVLNPVLAAALGIAIIEFSQSYWENHYQAYPWFAYWNHYYHPYHPVPGPYCYHAPQDPACHYAPYNPNRLYQTEHHHSHHHGHGHPHNHSHHEGSHGGHGHSHHDGSHHHH
ncbi:SH3 domain-containing protein [Ruegeria sp. 2205SS24-7]|uniref:SH3 domain-containing protein n=1 Tax=Ruegeria discodermiae TaxID=3064389 RepID=UPI002742695C|nr:SH3 domain-containing protein [Ruegeria sp. 2205SS24-7]MDP5219926.1 SH3 domain-containing protein [Ruegeria sp. 2205SS24-7]